MHKAIPDSVLLEGKQSPDDKIARINAFKNGDYRVKISKPRITGFGQNFQNCYQQAHCGLGYSWQAYYQTVRRSWRFGQTHPVSIHIILSKAEKEVLDAVQRKEKEAEELRSRLLACVKGYEVIEMTRETVRSSYNPSSAMEIPLWLRSAA